MRMEVSKDDVKNGEVDNEFVIVDADMYFDKQQHEHEDGPARLKAPTRLGFGKGKDLRTAIEVLKPSGDQIMWLLPKLLKLETQTHAEDDVDDKMMKKTTTNHHPIINKKQHHEAIPKRVDQASFEDQLERRKRKLQASYQANKPLIQPHNPFVRPMIRKKKNLISLRSQRPCMFRPTTAF